MSKDEKALWLGEVFRKVDWLIPSFQPIGFVELLARVIEAAKLEERLEVLEFTMAAIYNPQYLATMHLERYSRVPFMRDFAKHIDECFRAFFSCNRLVAISALIPVVEGIIRRFAASSGRDLGHGTQGVLRELEALIEDEKAAPHRYEERLIMFELLLEFMRDRFLKNTNRYDGLQFFNRHGILHGVFADFGEELNFYRLVMLLDLLCFIIIYRGPEQFSILAPEETVASKDLARQYERLRPPDAPKLNDRSGAVIDLYARVAKPMGL
jgi:hypothetical protein